MCPYFVSNENKNFCGGTPGRAFSPGERRQERHCRGGFMRCVFYQLKTRHLDGFQEGIRNKQTMIMPEGESYF